MVHIHPTHIHIVHVLYTDTDSAIHLYQFSFKMIFKEKLNKSADVVLKADLMHKEIDTNDTLFFSFFLK